MNKLLLNTPPLSVFPDLAVAIGLNESIILQQVHYWTYNNEQAKRNFGGGYYWTYNTYRSWKNQFPFWSERTIQRIIINLEKVGLLISGNFNKISIDQTKWYRIDYDKLKEMMDNANGELDDANTLIATTGITPPYDNANALTIVPKVDDGRAKSGSSVPETTTDINNNTRSPRVFSADFEKFWKEYPRKVEKISAYKCWIARLKDEIRLKDLIQAARNYAEWCRKEKKEQEYIKHPKTFLGPNRVWEEYLDGARSDEEADFAEYHPENLGWIPDLRDMTLEEHLADIEDFCERLIKKVKSVGGTPDEVGMRADCEKEKQEAREGKIKRPTVWVKKNEISRV